MLPILLMILKIMGIVVLALLGLILAVLLLVLLVPVRYGVSGSYYGKLQGTAKITWLLHALSLKVTYEDGLDVAVRVLGKRVFQKKMGEEETAEGIKEQLEESVRKAEELAEDGLWVDFVETAGEDEQEEKWGEEPGPEEGQDKRQEAGRGENREERRENMACGQGGEFEREDAWAGEQRESRTSGASAGRKERQKDRRREAEAPQDSQDSPERDVDGQGRGKDGGRGKSGDKGKRRGRKGKDKGKEKEPESGSAGPGVKEKLKGLKESAESTWTRLSEYKEKAVSFWNDERNQKTIKIILRQIRGIIRHVLPRKVRGKAVLGFNDPSATGKVLSALSVAYAWYGDGIEVVPVFDRSILEVEGSLKGRVQAGAIAARGVRVLLNKNFRRLAWSLIKNGGK